MWLWRLFCRVMNYVHYSRCTVPLLTPAITSYLVRSGRTKLFFIQNLSVNLFSADARGRWQDTGRRAKPSPISKKCFSLTYDHFSVVSWPCLCFSPPVPVLSKEQNHGCKDGFVLQGCFYSGSLEWSQRCLQRNTLSWGSQAETPEHQTARIAWPFPFQLQNLTVQMKTGLGVSTPI